MTLNCYCYLIRLDKKRMVSRIKIHNNIVITCNWLPGVKIAFFISALKKLLAYAIIGDRQILCWPFSSRHTVDVVLMNNTDNYLHVV